MGIGFNKIGGVNQIYKANKVEAKKTVSEAASTSNKKDQVQISKEAMDFQTVLKSVKLVNSLPDTREDVIAPIQEKLEKGTYEVDSKALAEKILKGSFKAKLAVVCLITICKANLAKGEGLDVRSFYFTGEREIV